MNKKLLIADVIKGCALISMFLYFAGIMIFSYKTEYFKIAHIIFALFAGFVVLYRITRISIVYTSFYIYIVIFLMFAISSYYWAIEKSVVTSRVETYFSLALFSVMIINILETPEELSFALKSFAIAGAMMCLYTFFFYGFDQIKIMLLEGERIGQEINEANSFSLICGLAYAIAICYAVYDEKNLFYAVSAILAISVFMTGSRTGVVGIVFITMFVIIFNAASRKIISSAIIVLVIVIAYNMLAQSEYFQFMFQRFELFGNFFNSGNNMVTADNSTETRMAMMRYGIEWFKHNPILGYGVDQYDILYEINFGRRRPSHNFHIQTLVEFGLIGASLWGTMFYNIIRNAYKTVKERTESKIMVILISYLILMGFGNMYTSEKVFWAILGLCFSYFFVYRSDFSTGSKRKLYSAVVDDTDNSAVTDENNQ